MSAFNDALRGFRAKFEGHPAPAPALDLNMIEVDDSTSPDAEAVHLARWAVNRSKRHAEADERLRRLADATPAAEFRAGHEPQEL